MKFGKNKINNELLEIERTNIEKLIHNLYVFSFDEKAAQKAANIYQTLESTGEKLDPFDCLIAASI